MSTARFKISGPNSMLPSVNPARSIGNRRTDWAHRTSTLASNRDRCWKDQRPSHHRSHPAQTRAYPTPHTAVVHWSSRNSGRPSVQPQIRSTLVRFTTARTYVASQFQPRHRADPRPTTQSSHSGANHSGKQLLRFYGSTTARYELLLIKEGYASEGRKLPSRNAEEGTIAVSVTSCRQWRRTSHTEVSHGAVWW